MNATDRLNDILPIAGFELPNQALVDLANAGFGNIRDYPYLSWDRPFSDVKRGRRILVDMSLWLAAPCPPLPCKPPEPGAFAPLLIRYPDDGYRPDRRV